MIKLALWGLLVLAVVILMAAAFSILARLFIGIALVIFLVLFLLWFTKWLFSPHDRPENNHHRRGS